MSERETPVKCDSCGKFIAYDDLVQRSRFRFVPLNEFGPEESDWTCPQCLSREKRNAA